MITKFETYNESESEDVRVYRGYNIVKDMTKTPGEDGLWIIPDLYWRKFGNKIEKGFKTVSLLQCRQSIDEWFDYSQKVKAYKDDE